MKLLSFYGNDVGTGLYEHSLTIDSMQVQTDEKNVKSKKSQKLASTSNFEEESNASPNGQSSSNCFSGDESNASQELSGGVASSGKARASRGSATDPQSLYARVSSYKTSLHILNLN